MTSIPPRPGQRYDGEMTEREKLERDIDTLRVSINEFYRDLASRPPMPAAERNLTVMALKLIVDDLYELIQKLEALDAQGS